MPRKNPLWSNFVNRKTDSRIWWNPRITDAFLDWVLSEDREWKEPPEWDFVIFHYNDKYHHLNSKYTINRNWEIKSLKWEIMKYIFCPNKRGPRIRIQIIKKDKSWNLIPISKELNILNLMEKNFWKYIIGYRKKIENPKKYILVPKDWDYNNLSYKNLEYIEKDDYYNRKKMLIKALTLPNSTPDNVAKRIWTTKKYVEKVWKNEWTSTKYNEYQELQRRLWIEFKFENYWVYKMLVESEWKLSNMEIARQIRPKELSETKNKRQYTDIVVRARKKLTDAWIIPRFNEQFESKRAEIVKRIENKANSGETSQQIADAFWVKKGQIDNLIRQINKKETRKNH